MLQLTLNKYDPLVINDAEIIIRIVRIEMNQVVVEIEADRNTALNRGIVYLRKKLSDSNLCFSDYITTPTKAMWDENSEELAELLEVSHERVKTEDWWTNVNLPEKTQKLLSVIGKNRYLKLIELFLAKFLFSNKLPLNDESILAFKKDFLGYEYIEETTL